MSDPCPVCAEKPGPGCVSVGCPYPFDEPEADMTPDDFADAARTKILLAFRDTDAVSKNLTFGEGYKLASEIASDMAAIYRAALTSTMGTKS